MFEKHKVRRYDFFQYLLVVIILMLTNLQVSAQTLHIDSLKQVIQSTTHSDSLKVMALKEWDDLIYQTNAELDAKLNRQIDSICQTQLKHENKSETRQFFLKLRSQSLNNLGINLKRKGDISGALSCYLQSLEIKKELSNLSSLSNTTNNIGNLYLLQGEYDLAGEFIHKALAIRDSLKDTLGMAECYNNLGSVKRRQNKEEESLTYFLKSDSLYRKLDTVTENSLIAVSNIGVHYSYFSGAEEKEKAMFYCRRALDLAKKISSIRSMEIAHKNIGIIYLNQKKYTDAIRHAQQAVDLSKKVQDNIAVTDAYRTLYRAHQELGNTKRALSYYKQYVTIRDSIRSRENERNLLKYKYQYQYEKKAYADSLKNEEERKVTAAILAKERAENAQYRSQQIMLFGGIGILIIFLLVVYNRFMVTRNQKQLIEKQKVKIEEAAETRLELERLKQERLRSDLTNAAQEITRRQEWLEQFKEKLSKVKSNNGKTQEINEVFVDIVSQMQLDSRTKEFYKNIDKVNQEFFRQLKELFPKLTQNELELSGLIRLNLSTKEMSNIRNIEPHSIRIARSRLRKKLGLEKDDSLEDFLQKV